MSKRYLAMVSMWLWTIMALVPMVGTLGVPVFTVAWFTFMGLQVVGFGMVALMGLYMLYGED